MTGRDSITIAYDIMTNLSQKHLGINNICTDVNLDWRTAKRYVDFLLGLKLIRIEMEQHDNYSSKQKTIYLPTDEGFKFIKLISFWVESYAKNF